MREFSTDTRFPLRTVHASIRLPSLLLRVAPFPPMFLPLFFLEPACILVMYYLWLSTDPRRTKPILSSDASGQQARRGNLFDTLYANSAPIASSNSAISSPLSSRNNFFDYVTPMRPSPPFSVNLPSRFYSLAESRENSTELRRDERRFRIPFGISFEPMRGETPAES